MGLMKRSYFGGLRVKPSPTKQTFVTILFHAFFCLFPVLMTLSTSVSPWARTLGRGTSHLPCKRHYMFEFKHPWHLDPSLPQYYNKGNKRNATWQPLRRRLPVSWHLRPFLSSSVWSCWREPLRGTVLLCPRGMQALLLLGSYRHSSAWSSSVHAFLCCKDTSQSCMDICQGLLYWRQAQFGGIYSRLFHLDLLCMSLFVVQFGLQTNQLPGFVRTLVSLTALLLPFLFMVVKAIAMPLTM